MLGELIKEPFLGFQKEALKFLKDLSNDKNNNKVWFDKNRETYEIYLKKPMRDLIDTLAIEINKIDPDIVVNYKSIFRINRDIRFQKIKCPTKIYILLLLHSGGLNPQRSRSFIFILIRMNSFLHQVNIVWIRLT